MKKISIITDYLKKIEGNMREISAYAHCSGEIRTEMYAMAETLQEKTGGKIILLFIELSLQFFYRLLSILLSREKDGENERINRNRMLKIDHYIRTNLEKNINLQSAADYIGMSTGYFSRFFNKMFDCSFVEYLMRSRVDFAVKLLTDSDMQIIDVCYRSGFNTPNQFNRTFRKEKKTTPSGYRKSIREAGSVAS